MREVKTERTIIFTDVNSFNQLTSRRESVIETTIYGTVDELNEVENVFVKRSPATEKFFPEWEDSAKYVVIDHGEPKLFACKASDISGARSYVPEYIIDEKTSVISEE